MVALGSNRGPRVEALAGLTDSALRFARSSDTESVLDAASERARHEGEAAEDAYWQTVTQLHAMPTRQVFERSVRWCSSTDADERRLGADVLGQLGFADGASRRPSRWAFGAGRSVA